MEPHLPKEQHFIYSVVLMNFFVLIRDYFVGPVIILRNRNSFYSFSCVGSRKSRDRMFPLQSPRNLRPDEEIHKMDPANCREMLNRHFKRTFLRTVDDYCLQK